MEEKIITIEIPKSLELMKDRITYISQRLKFEIDKLPAFDQVNWCQMICLITLNTENATYLVRYGQVREQADCMEETNAKKVHAQSEATRYKISETNKLKTKENRT